jgi:hypothetical protein
MPTQHGSIREERPLTVEEAALVRWLLEHANCGVDTTTHLAQVERARVTARCGCGCPSIDFAIDGQELPANTGLRVLADYFWTRADGAVYGVIVFAKGHLLAGLEVWSCDGTNTPDCLPSTSALKSNRPADVGA